MSDEHVTEAVGDDGDDVQDGSTTPETPTPPEPPTPGPGDDADQADADAEEQDFSDNYVGVDAEYRNSATDSEAPTSEPDAVGRRVQLHMEAMAQPAPGTVGFAEWAARRRGG